MAKHSQIQEVEEIDLQTYDNHSLKPLVPNRLNSEGSPTTQDYDDIPKYNYRTATVSPEPEEPAATNDSSPQGPGITLSIILLTSCAIIPAFMGAMFYISIGFKAPDGVYYSNGTFVRPISEGAIIGGVDSFITAHFSPLLVSSIASSVIGVVSPFVMCLVAYHLAVSWLSASFAHPNHLPTPQQYYHTLNLVTNVSPTSIIPLLGYAMRHIRLLLSPRTTPRPTSPVLKIAAVGAIVVLSVTWAIRLIDIVLHEQIISTILYVPNRSRVSYPGRVAIAPDCLTTTTDNCAVINRTNTASLGGLNQSTIFKVYEHGSSDPSRNQSIAFIGPADVASHTNLNYTSHTFAASTECQVFHPACYVENQAIQYCYPTYAVGDPEPVLSNWNSFVWRVGFNTSAWQMRLQTFLTLRGNLTEPTNSLTNGANLNPFTTGSFGCFADYSSIPYNDTNSGFKTPFINWWTYGAGIGNKPYILCSISLCNTTVYDAEYTLFNGTLTLDNSTFSKSNASAAVAVSSAGLYLGTGDTNYYQWGSRFLDDQIQLDLSSAGNTYGNSTSEFSAAWAQAFSNRYLGWSAGAITMDKVDAESRSAELALQIPLATTHAFAALHFAYAFGIVVLGISCLALPNSKRWGWNRLGASPGSFNAQDLRSAQVRVSDTSLLVHELSSRPGPGEELRRRQLGGYADSYTGLMESASVSGHGTSRSGDLRVCLERRDNGGLGFDFRKRI